MLCVQVHRCTRLNLPRGWEWRGWGQAMREHALPPQASRSLSPSSLQKVKLWGWRGLAITLYSLSTCTLGASPPLLAGACAGVCSPPAASPLPLPGASAGAVFASAGAVPPADPPAAAGGPEASLPDIPLCAACHAPLTSDFLLPGGTAASGTHSRRFLSLSFHFVPATCSSPPHFNVTRKNSRILPSLLHIYD